MKKVILTALAITMMGFAASAQNTMVVNTETVFRSITAYNNALTTLERLSEQYQTEIDNEFAQIEEMYNTYMQERARLNETQRASRENAIIERENRANQRQEDLLGQEGQLMRRRAELITPIQERVFNAINTYAQRNNFAVVLDVASNPTVLYYAPASDRTNDIVNAVR